MSQHNSNYSTTFIILIVSKYLLTSTILFTQYILTPVHPLNTIWQIIYFKKKLGVLGATYSFSSPTIISICQRNYISKIFTSLNYTFHSIYSNTSPSTEYSLPNHLFKKKIRCVGGHIFISIPQNHFDMSEKLHLKNIYLT